MKIKTLFIALTAVFMLSGCAFLKDNVAGIAGGAAAVASAPTIQRAIGLCVAGDAEAIEALQTPQAFFKIGYDVITEKGADVPVLTLIEESTNYYEAIPENWSMIWAVLDDKDCGPVVAQWRESSEAAFEVVEGIVARKSKLEKACGLWNAYGPVAAMFSPIPLPKSVPGCS